IEQPIHGEAARLEVDAEEAGEEQVRLPGFDGDGGRDAARFEVPAVGANGVRGDAPAARHRERLAFDERDLINQLQWAIGEANAADSINFWLIRRNVSCTSINSTCTFAVASMSGDSAGTPSGDNALSLTVTMIGSIATCGFAGGTWPTGITISGPCFTPSRWP